MNSFALGSKYFEVAADALHTEYVFAGVDQNCAPRVNLDAEHVAVPGYVGLIYSP